MPDTSPLQMPRHCHQQGSKCISRMITLGIEVMGGGIGKFKPLASSVSSALHMKLHFQGRNISQKCDTGIGVFVYFESEGEGKH